VSALLAALLLVPAVDQAVKVIVRRRLGSGALTLGPLGQVRVVAAPLWLSRVSRRSTAAATWTLWLLAAAALGIAGAWIPSSNVFVGLILGGSLSNGLESSIRGGVTDYVCLRFWPAFNLADVALTTGAVGVAVALATAVR
jgi:lipoprotein signal peptidase